MKFWYHLSTSVAGGGSSSLSSCWSIKELIFKTLSFTLLPPFATCSPGAVSRELSATSCQGSTSMKSASLTSDLAATTLLASRHTRPTCVASIGVKPPLLVTAFPQPVMRATLGRAASSLKSAPGEPICNSKALHTASGTSKWSKMSSRLVKFRIDSHDPNSAAMLHAADRQTGYTPRFVCVIPRGWSSRCQLEPKLAQTDPKAHPPKPYIISPAFVSQHKCFSINQNIC